MNCEAYFAARCHRDTIPFRRIPHGFGFDLGPTRVLVDAQKGTFEVLKMNYREWDRVTIGTLHTEEDCDHLIGVMLGALLKKIATRANAVEVRP